MAENVKTKTYTIKLDEPNWQLVENSTTKNGDPSEKIIGYYGTLENLVRAAHNKMLMIHGLEDIKGAMDDANSIVEKAVKIITEPTELALAKVDRSRKTVDTPMT